MRPLRPQCLHGVPWSLGNRGCLRRGGLHELRYFHTILQRGGWRQDLLLSTHNTGALGAGDECKQTRVFVHIQRMKEIRIECVSLTTMVYSPPNNSQFPPFQKASWVCSRLLENPWKFMKCRFLAALRKLWGLWSCFHQSSKLHALSSGHARNVYSRFRRRGETYFNRRKISL